MPEVWKRCVFCGVGFQRPEGTEVPEGMCFGCWDRADRHLQERDDLADRQAAEAADPGRHYRWEIRRRITDADISRGWVSVTVDPYRICRVAGVGGGPHEHSVKKLLRGEAKGHEARELIREVRCCLDRWEEMLTEDEEEARCK